MRAESPSLLKAALPAAARRPAYHCEVSWTCSSVARAAGLNSRRKIAGWSETSAWASSSRCWAYFDPSPTLCDSRARLSARPEAPKAPPTSASIGYMLRGSSSATSSTREPCFSASLATSRQSVAPKECPARRYGPGGHAARISSRSRSANSAKVVGQDVRGAASFGQDTPKAGTGKSAASAWKPPACKPAPGTRKRGTPAERSLSGARSRGAMAAASSSAAALPFGAPFTAAPFAAAVQLPSWESTKAARDATVG
mmetsp:Transcript_102363/g.320078  ORF Transcript_102363/g.320078 Transcript_102363/m.320078 type:complete len:256 (-) Transcript_102363:695-1462(-)